jgi:hypothetical protein
MVQIGGIMICALTVAVGRLRVMGGSGTLIRPAAACLPSTHADLGDPSLSLVSELVERDDRHN